MIERFLRFAFARRGTVLLAAGALLTVSVLLVARLSFETDILRLLPRDGPAVQSFDAYLRHFGTIDHVYVLFEVPPGAQISDGEAFVDEYVDRLRRAPEIASVDAELFDDVKDWSYLFDRELFLLGPEQARLALERLVPVQMARELAQSRGLLSMPSPEVKALVQQDPVGLLGMLRDRLGRGRALVDFDPTQKGYVSRDGRSRLVMAKPVRPPFDTEFCKRLFARLALVEAEARSAASAPPDAEPEAAPVPVTVQVAGGYRIALDAERVIRRELIVNSLTSLAGVLLLVLIVFRTPWILVLGTVPLALAALLTLGVNGLRGPLSPATSGNSAMLFGLGIDGVVLLYLRYVEERARGRSREDAIARTSGTAGGVVLAYATTAATFLALLFVDFPTLEDLGRLVGLGMLASLALVLALLPALVGYSSPGRAPRPISSPWLGRLVERRGRLILVVAAIVTLVLGTFATHVRLNTSLETLEAQTEGTVLEETIADRFALPRDVLLAVGQGDELEPLLESARAIAAEVARLLPSVTVSAPDAVLPPASEQDAVSRLLGQQGLDPAGVAADLGQEAAAAGFRPGAFAPFVERLPRLLDPAGRITYEGLVDHGLTPLLSRYMAPVPNGFLVVVHLYPRGPGDLDRLRALVAGVAPSFQLTGVPAVNQELAERFLPQFLRGVIIGTLAVALLIYLGFRNVRDTLLAFLPTALGFIWSTGLLALFGFEIDLFSLFAALTFVGIATDYAVHVIHRHSVEGVRPMRDVLTHTGAGILIAGATTLIGFGSLINSSYAPLHSFGVTSVITIAACLVASLLVLPAILQEARRP